MKETTTVRVLALVAAAVMNLAIATGLHLLAVGQQATPTMAGDTQPAGQRVATTPSRGG
jgi:hypothetical protein